MDEKLDQLVTMCTNIQRNIVGMWGPSASDDLTIVAFTGPRLDWSHHNSPRRRDEQSKLEVTAPSVAESGRVVTSGLESLEASLGTSRMPFFDFLHAISSKRRPCFFFCPSAHVDILYIYNMNTVTLRMASFCIFSWGHAAWFIYLSSFSFFSSNFFLFSRRRSKGFQNSLFKFLVTHF